MRHAWWLVLFQLAAACGGKAVIDRETPAGGGHGTTTSGPTTTTATGGGGVGGATADLCQLCAAATPTSNGGLANPKLDEASGLAASRVHRGVFYVMNDSGGAATVFAIDASGADLASYALAGAVNLDWEDMASGPCSDGAGACLYVGDIGDNLGMRSSYTVYRVREPEVIEAGAHTIEADAFTFTYPDGSHNSEALVADPTTGSLYLVTKVKEGPSGVYALPPLVSTGPLVAARVGDLTVPTGIPRVTAASASAGGVLVRTYTNLFLYNEGKTVAEHLLGEGCPVAAAAEAQGETVAWLPDGSGYLTVSEGPGSAIYQYACAP